MYYVRCNAIYKKLNVKKIYIIIENRTFCLLKILWRYCKIFLK